MLHLYVAIGVSDLLNQGSYGLSMLSAHFYDEITVLTERATQ